MLDFSFVCCRTLNKSFNLESRYLMYKVGTRAASLESCKCFCCIHSLTFWFFHNSVLELLEVKACVLPISNFECPTNGRHSINDLWSLSNICHNNNHDFLFKGNASFFFSFLTFWETSTLFYKVPASIYNFIWRTQFSSVQSLSLVWLFATPWIAARQASLSITNSQSSLKLMSIEAVMSSSHLILCRPLFLLPPIPPSIRAFTNESILCMRWTKYWSFSFKADLL